MEYAKEKLGVEWRRMEVRMVDGKVDDDTFTTN